MISICILYAFERVSGMSVRTVIPEEDRLLQSRGYAVFQGVLDEEWLRNLRADLDTIYAKRRAVQERNGIAAGMSGTCHHLLGEASAMGALIATLPLDAVLRRYFDGPYILNSFGGFLNGPDTEYGYIAKVHRDVRTYTDTFKLMVNMLIMLDDFTAENGATRLLAGSHKVAEKPTDRAFETDATPALGRAGDILLFDSRLWHAAGQNRSGAVRRALTLTFSRPFVKPQLDYPRYLGSA